MTGKLLIICKGFFFSSDLFIQLVFYTILKDILIMSFIYGRRKHTAQAEASMSWSRTHNPIGERLPGQNAALAANLLSTTRNPYPICQL